mgnify:FL=1
MNTKSLILLLFAICVNASFAQKKFSKSELYADADSLYAIIDDYHPNMFEVMPKEAFEKELTSIKASFVDSMTVIDFYKKMAPLVVKLGDGHTFLNLDDKCLNGLQPKCFPLKINIDKKNLSLTMLKDLAESGSIPIGAEILSINGVESRDVIFSLLKYVSGEKDFYRLESLKLRFGYLLWIEYLADEYEISYRYNDEPAAVCVIPAVDPSVVFGNINESSEDREPYVLDIDEDKSIATIDFRSFDNLDKFKVFLDSSFSEIKKKNINNLIIDVRNNGGGYSALGKELFQYISSVPFELFGHTTVKIGNRLWNKLSEEAKAKSKRGLTIYDDSKLIELRDNPLRYTGNTYLLTSNYTFSSAADFAWVFKYFNMGTVVGEETGGQAVCFGDIRMDYLPITKLPIGMSCKKFYVYGATDENTHGAIPHYEVDADQAMDYVLNMINPERKH